MNAALPTADDAGARRIAGHGTTEAAWSAGGRLAGVASIDVDAWATRYRRIVVVAPHPDDEVLALGGTLARLAAVNADVRVVSVTDGEASHRDSAAWPALRLAQERPEELRRALDRLRSDARVLRLGLPDGGLAARGDALFDGLGAHVGPDDLLLTTWRFDGHPDHEACAAAALDVGSHCGATVFEYPVWMWHWATPDETTIPWARARRIALPPAIRAQKRAALAAFASQLEADGAAPAILPPHVLPRFLRPFEIVFV